ncbi:MAG: hypothetical protein PHE88_10225 [Elusimicrobia bacterium]|nr:hypothetical protein [Elusimicrobiota bacterium]
MKNKINNYLLNINNNYSFSGLAWMSSNSSGEEQMIPASPDMNYWAGTEVFFGGRYFCLSAQLLKLVFMIGN